ncbi:MAG TPA: DNA methyltransferase [Pseudolabrys sp.]|uniref:DNA methyltransferase n=1 Tax=Pseudolabrys sp. TaxID=1960880 RepID=UPI002DDD871F|nr:DNA methyltransferase [Pseudolabrys sp.]HEV2629441.1 DNA methyltransferase [Pseudolabrys sp.]
MPPRASRGGVGGAAGARTYRAGPFAANRIGLNHSETIDLEHNLGKFVHHPGGNGVGEMNKLYFGDNLDVLREKIKDESVDLIYLDPPFNSDANYNVLFKHGGTVSQAQAEAFRDTWDWGDHAEHAYDDIIRANGDVALVVSGFRKWLGENGMMAYLAMITARIIEMRRVLKPTGSMYLHCDPTASAYLKVILDAVWGHENFRNEVIWKRTQAHGRAKRWGPIHDNILFYSASDKYTWNRVYEKYNQSYLDSHYRTKDGNGTYQSVTLDGPGTRTGSSGQPWRGIDPTRKGRHWELPPDRALPDWFKHPPGYPEMSVQERLDILEAAGIVYWPPRGKTPRYKRYLSASAGNPIQDMITDIDPINSQAQERLRYPTQKPIALLERILGASSNEGDVVLDPFCGCGTTIEAAERMKRKWMGIDVTHYAVTLIEGRLKSMGASQNSYQVAGRPVDLAGARELAARDKHQFQWWAAWRLGARWYREEKKGADRGIDGRMMFKNGPYGDGLIIISVKGGENVGVQMVRDLRGVIEREGAEMGILISLTDPTGPMKTEAAAAGYVSKSAHGRVPRLQIVTIEEILEGKMPKLPPLPQPDRIERTARRKQFKDQMELLLPFAGDKVGPAKGDFVDPSIMAFA